MIDASIVYYLENNYTDSQQAELFGTLELLQALEYTDVTYKIKDLIFAQDYEPSTIKDMVYKLIEDTINFIITEHFIFLSSNASLADKNSIVDMILAIQSLEEFFTIKEIIQNEENDNLDKLIEILNTYATITEDRARSIIENVDPIFFRRINKFIREYVDVTNEVSYNDKDKAIIANMQLFIKFMNNVETLGSHLLEAGSSVSVNFESHIPFILTHLKEATIEHAIKDIYSILLITRDGSINPLECFRKYSNQLYTNLNTIKDIDNGILRLSSDFNTYKQALQR